MRCIPTPDTILEDDEIDVFESIIPEEDDYHDVMRQALWNTYRFRGIGNPDLAYWIRAMQARYGQIRTIYQIKFKALDEWLSSISGETEIDMSDGSYDLTQSTTYGHVISTSIGVRKNTAEREDNPDNPQGSTKYLSSRDTVTDDAASDSDTHSGIDTVHYVNKSYSGLSSETVSRFMESVTNLERQFADEFRMQFYHGA